MKQIESIDMYRRMSYNHPSFQEMENAVASAIELEAKQGRYTAAINLTPYQRHKAAPLLNYLNRLGYQAELVGEATLAVSWV